MEIGFWGIYAIAVVYMIIMCTVFIWNSGVLSAQDVILAVCITLIPILNVGISVLTIIMFVIYLVEEGDKIVLWRRMKKE